MCLYQTTIQLSVAFVHAYLFIGILKRKSNIMLAQAINNFRNGLKHVYASQKAFLQFIPL